MVIAIAAAASAAEHLRRTCPNCRKKQSVPASKARKAVKCRHCGSEIPPRKRK